MISMFFHYTLKSWFVEQKFHLGWGRFIEQKLMLSSNFSCYQIHTCHRYDFGHTLLLYLIQTLMFNKPASGALDVAKFIAMVVKI